MLKYFNSYFMWINIAFPAKHLMKRKLNICQKLSISCYKDIQCITKVSREHTFK